MKRNNVKTILCVSFTYVTGYLRGHETISFGMAMALMAFVVIMVAEIED